MRLPGPLAAVVVAVGIVAGVAVWRSSAGDDATGSSLPAFSIVKDSVPENRLLQDALDITSWRDSGKSINFSYVPKNRPPELTRMGIGGEGAAITDTYQFGAKGFQAIAAFSAVPTDTCKYAEEGQIEALCVQNGRLDIPPPADGKVEETFRNLTVYFTGNVGGKPTLGDPTTATAKRFWEGTEIVPINEAAWFTDLVARGRAALVRTG